MGGGGVCARVRCIQSINVREQNKLIGICHLRHAGGQTIIVSKADFSRGNGVVFVDDGYTPKAQQGFQCGASVQVALAVFRIFGRQQKLGGC